MTPAATATARSIVRALTAQGVRHVVLCPGSRSAPLAYALAAADQAGWLRLHVRVDERSAAFLALGLSRADADADQPVAVVTTSGTAVANLHPAVLEASHAGRPLLLVTADRPHELRGTGANQTADQVGIFGSAVRWSTEIAAGAAPDVGAQAIERSVAGLVARAVASARGLRTGDPGPVHVNVAFREPLAPDETWVPGVRPSPRPQVDGPARRARAYVADAFGVDAIAATAAAARAVPAGESGHEASSGAFELERGPRTVVVAGDGAGPDARLIAEAAGWPLLAEPTSAARAGSHAVGPYRLLLAVPALADEIERVVVLGHPTLSRPVSRLLGRDDVEIVVVAPVGARWTDVAGAAANVCGSVTIKDRRDEPGRGVVTRRREDLGTLDPDGSADTRWLARWQRAAAAAEVELADVIAGGALSGLAVAREVAAAAEAGLGGARTLVLGASMAVRDVDLAATPPRGGPAPGGGARVLANRGLSGIDGTLASAAGIALGSGVPVRALVGDLTFLHDLAGLATGTLEQAPDLQVVVVNDDGGAIFATLEHGADRLAGVFERVFGTPHGAAIGALCAGYGVRHDVVTTVDELRQILAEPVHGRSVVEVPVRRDHVRQDRETLAGRTRAAVEAALAEGG